MTLQTPAQLHRRARGALAKLYVELRSLDENSARTSMSVAVGGFIGCLPLFGLHWILCLGAAKAFRLSPTKTYLTAFLNNPFTAPFLLYLAFGFGSLATKSVWPSLAWSDLKSAGLADLSLDLLVGSVLLGGLVGSLLGLIAHWLAPRRVSNALTSAIFGRTAARYLPISVTHWEFTRAKLRLDPVFRHLLTKSDFSTPGTLLDLGTGRGLALAVLLEAQKASQDQRWPVSWTVPSESLRMLGIELNPKGVAVAVEAVPEVSIQATNLAHFEPPDHRYALLIDVLHYMQESEQQALVARLAAKLEVGGSILVREACTDGGSRFWLTRIAERMRALGRGHWKQQFHYRSAVGWRGLLESQGLAMTEKPMAAGTPFANSLFEAVKPALTSPDKD